MFQFHVFELISYLYTLLQKKRSMESCVSFLEECVSFEEECMVTLNQY